MRYAYRKTRNASSGLKPCGLLRGIGIVPKIVLVAVGRRMYREAQAEERAENDGQGGGGGGVKFCLTMGRVVRFIESWTDIDR